jgi:hypothetical protein
MQEVGVSRQHPELKELAVQASQALSRLDADVLEQLALSCGELSRKLHLDLIPVDIGVRADLARQAGDAARDMAVFARVLEATRANLNVLKRLRELRAGRLEYREVSAAAGREWAITGGAHGDH